MSLDSWNSFSFMEWNTYQNRTDGGKTAQEIETAFQLGERQSSDL